MPMPNKKPTPQPVVGLDELQRQLEVFARANYGDGAHVQNLRGMEAGHAGLSFGFTIAAPDGGGEDLVMRLAPKGIRLRGNTDVYRQAPLLRALHKAGLPVPAVRYAGRGAESTDPNWFETPFIMVEKRPGGIYFPWQPEADMTNAGQDPQAYWHQAMETLIEIHSYDWRSDLNDWQPPEGLEAEITRWDRIIAQSPEPAWIDQAHITRELLLKTLPVDQKIGLFHGDYQPGNILYHNGQLEAVLDWEISGIGSPLLDVGWFLMIGDRESWSDSWKPASSPVVADMVAMYEDGMGFSCPEVPWYRALAGYRLGAIGCLNVKLHRRGQREDIIWEHFATAIPRLFGRAAELLHDYETS